MTEQEAQEAQQTALEVRKRLKEAADSKKAAVENILKKLPALEEASSASHVWGVNDVRNLESLIGSIVTILRTQDAFMEQQAHDQFMMAHEMNNLNHNVFMTAATAETLKNVMASKEILYETTSSEDGSTVLLTKPFLTDEDMKAEWSKVMATADTAAVPEQDNAEPTEQVAPSRVIDLASRKR